MKWLKWIGGVLGVIILILAVFVGIEWILKSGGRK